MDHGPLTTDHGCQDTTDQEEVLTKATKGTVRKGRWGLTGGNRENGGRGRGGTTGIPGRPAEGAQWGTRPQLVLLLAARGGRSAFEFVRRCVGQGLDIAVADDALDRGPDCGRGEVGGLLELVGDAGLGMEFQVNALLLQVGLDIRARNQGDDRHADGL